MSATAAGPPRASARDGDDRARLAVVGLGEIGRFHAELLSTAIPEARLRRVVDQDGDLARGVGRALGVAWSDDLDAALLDEALDGVVIATPTSLHAAMVELAAVHGKHVLCEKPLTLDLAHGWRAVDAARAAGVHLMVGFQRRFDARWRAAKARVRAQELGTVRLLRATHRNMAPVAGAGYGDRLGDLFADVMVHDFDIARWLAGEVVEVSAVGAALASPAESDAIDTAVAALRFADGGLGVVDATRLAGYGFDCSGEVIGSLASVRIGMTAPESLELLLPGRRVASLALDHLCWFHDAYVEELRHFARCVISGEPPEVTGEDAMAASIVAQAATTSLERGRPVGVVGGREEQMSR